MNRTGQSLILGALLLVACKPKSVAVAQREDATSPTPTGSTVLVNPDAGLVAPTTAPEAPLAWGTRPAQTGSLFAVIDGLCVDQTIWPTEGKTTYSFGRTFARFEEDGLVRDESYEKQSEKGRADAWDMTTFGDISGTWPRLVLHSNDRGPGRMRTFESIWVHEEAGWSYFGSFEEKDGPAYSVPIQYKDWLISARRGMVKGENSEGPTGPTLIQTWPMKKGATPIPGVASLARAKFSARSFAAAGDSLYAFGWNDGGPEGNVVRVLKDGKVSEGNDRHESRGVIGTHGDSIFVLGSNNVIRQYDGAKSTALPIKVAKGEVVTGAGVAPNGDVWALTSKNVVMVLHDGAVANTTLPESTAKLPKKPANLEIGGTNRLLVGVELDDPYAANDEGVVFHFEGGAWHELPMPTPPFATNGKYRSERLYLPAKGDLYVSATYSEKGVGWNNAGTYRAILRTHRPKETLRCNEAAARARADIEPIGRGFSSSPPVADDTCKTPLVITMRVGTKKEPSMLYDRELPLVRAAVKATPALGETADLLEIPWGAVQAIGLKAPDMETAKAFAINAGKVVKNDYLRTNPEIVCAVPPTIDKTMPVDVKTGKFIKPAK